MMHNETHPWEQSLHLIQVLSLTLKSRVFSLQLQSLSTVFNIWVIVTHIQGEAKVGLQFEYANQSLFLNYYLLIIVLFICITTVHPLLSHTVCPVFQTNLLPCGKVRRRWRSNVTNKILFVLKSLCWIPAPT